MSLRLFRKRRIASVYWKLVIGDSDIWLMNWENYINDNFWQAISVFMFQGECTVNLINLFSKPSTPILTWTNPRQSFLGNYDYASHFTYNNSSVSVRFHFLVCCSITFRCNVVDSGNMLFIQVKGTHG